MRNRRKSTLPANPTARLIKEQANVKLIQQGRRGYQKEHRAKEAKRAEKQAAEEPARLAKEKARKDADLAKEQQ
jgi:hypothetical protein